MISTALLALSDVETYLKIEGATNDEEALLEGMIEGATTGIEAYCGRPFVERSVEERLDGDGGSKLFPSEPDVASITSVQILNLDGTVYRAIASGDLYLNQRVNAIHAINGESFDRGEVNVLLKYKAGLGVPGAIAQAALIWVASLWAQRQNRTQDVTAASMQGSNVSFIPETIPPKVRGLIDPFKRPVLG